MRVANPFIYFHSVANRAERIKGMGSDIEDIGLCIADSNTSLTVGGSYRNTMDLDFGAGANNITPSNVTNGNGPRDDAFVATYNFNRTGISDIAYNALKNLSQPSQQYTKCSTC